MHLVCGYHVLMCGGRYARTCVLLLSVPNMYSHIHASKQNLYIPTLSQTACSLAMYANTVSGKVHSPSVPNGLFIGYVCQYSGKVHSPSVPNGLFIGDVC